MKIKFAVICALAIAGVCLIVADADAGRAERQARRAARGGGGYSACGASSMGGYSACSSSMQGYSACGGAQSGYSACGPAQGAYYAPPAPVQYYSPPAQYYSAPTMSCPSGSCPVSVIESHSEAVETVQVVETDECCCEDCDCDPCECGKADAKPVVWRTATEGDSDPTVIVAKK